MTNKGLTRGRARALAFRLSTTSFRLISIAASSCTTPLAASSSFPDGKSATVTPCGPSTRLLWPAPKLLIRLDLPPAHALDQLKLLTRLHGFCLLSLLVWCDGRHVSQGITIRGMACAQGVRYAGMQFWESAVLRIATGVRYAGMQIWESAVLRIAKGVKYAGMHSLDHADLRIAEGVKYAGMHSLDHAVLGPELSWEQSCLGKSPEQGTCNWLTGMEGKRGRRDNLSEAG